MQIVKFGSDPKVLPPNVHFTDQTIGAIGQNIFFCFSKVIKVYKLLKSGGSPSFFAKENTQIKCTCYINNMFSKIFINQAFK